MPFLFVDYDQGAGGEFICAQLSQSPQCVPLAVTQYNTGRSKVQDRFGQEFLKPVPNPVAMSAHPTLYDLVPTHRSCDLAKKLLQDVCTIRIANPHPNSDYWQYLLYQRKTKVLLAPQPEGKYLIGELKILINKTGRRDWVKYVNKDMNNLTLQMMADGIEPTEQAQAQYLENLLTHDPEPDFDYDLVVPYEKLFTDPKGVAIVIKSCFGVDVVGNWLETFNKNYEAYHQTT
jgi:hypothetical protein